MESSYKKNEKFLWKACPPIPEGTKPLEHQVAGHIFGRTKKQKNQLGFLQDTVGFILKPVQGGIKGLRELRFYEFIKNQSNDLEQSKKILSEYLSKEADISEIKMTESIITPTMCHDINTLQTFVPKYHGIWDTPVHPGVGYMKLENLTVCYTHPCIMDVKVGCITYDKFADDEKIKRELTKCPALKEICFQLVGMKVFDQTKKEYITLERNFLRNLKPDELIQNGLGVFFPRDHQLSQHLISVFIEKLRSIKTFFEKQRILTFIASSLLFVYDAKVLNSDFGGSILDSEALKLIGLNSDVKMIDFTHVFPSNNNIDSNYLDGLESLMKYLESLKIILNSQDD